MPDLPTLPTAKRELREKLDCSSVGIVSQKRVKFAHDNIIATHEFCANHMHYQLRLKRPHRPLNCKLKHFQFSCYVEGMKD